MKCIANTELFDSDWKTQLALGYGNIPKGAEVKYLGELINYYGVFAKVLYDGRVYSVRVSGLTFQR